jgi:hypothetical protein
MKTIKFLEWGMVVHTDNPNTHETEAQGSWVPGHVVRLCLQKQTNKKHKKPTNKPLLRITLDKFHSMI